MNSDRHLDSAASAPEATAFERAQRATELALEVRNQHPDDLGAQKAWEALATARALMYGAYSADEFLYSARAEAEVAIRRALHLIFDVAWKYHHPEPGRASWHHHYDDYPAIGAWNAAADSAGASIGAAYPPGFWDDFKRLRDGDAAALETAIQFLEADPWFFRAGYVKERLIRFVKRSDLSAEQMARLRQVVMRAIEGRDSREFRCYCRLAQRVATPEFRAELEDLVQPWDGSTPYQTLRREKARAQYDRRYRRHIQWVLGYIDGQPLPTGRTMIRRALALARAARRRTERHERATE
jgi:hypothetical protein